MPRRKARDDLLEAAEALFLERGVTSTALDDVCERARASKGALFYHFDSKAELAAEAVSRFGDRLSSAVPPAAGPGAPERLFGFLDAVARSPGLAAGCLLGMATMDCAWSAPDVANVAGVRLRDIRSLLADLVTAAAAERDVDVDARGLAVTILAAVEGGLLLDRHTPGLRSTKTAIGHVKDYLSILLTRKENA